MFLSRSTKAQNQNIVVAHFSAYFSKMFQSFVSFFLFQGENDVVQKFVLEDFSTEWIDIKKLVWWWWWFLLQSLCRIVGLLGWGEIQGGSFCQMVLDALGNCRRESLLWLKNAKFSKFKERKKKLKYFMREGFFRFCLWGGYRGVLFSCNFLFSLAQDGFFLIFGVMPKSVHIFQSYIIAKNRLLTKKNTSFYMEFGGVE